VGAALVRHKDVPIISFTGGTLTAQRIITDSARHYKKLSLELGGKNPNIIFDDADLSQAVPTRSPRAALNDFLVSSFHSQVLL